MKTLVKSGKSRIVISGLSIREIGDFSKRYARIMEISRNAATASKEELELVKDFFTPDLAKSDEIMVQLLSARLVHAGIHEDIFLLSFKDEDQEKLFNALPLSEDTAELDTLIKAWKEVNPDFLSWSDARLVGQMITRMCRRMVVAPATIPLGAALENALQEKGVDHAEIVPTTNEQHPGKIKGTTGSGLQKE